MSLVNAKFLKQQCPEVEVHSMPTPISVTGIGSNRHTANQYAMVDFYFKSTSNSTAHFKREIHLVEDLKANALIGNDILGPEGIVLDLKNEKATVGACQNLELALEVKTRSPQIRRSVLVRKKTVIPPGTRQAIPVHGVKGNPLELPTDRDLLFEPRGNQKVAVFAHIVDCTIEAVFVQNDSTKDITLPRNTRLGDVVEYETDGYFVASPEDAGLAARPAKQKSWIKRAWKGALAAAAVFHSGTTPSLETTLANGVTVYREQASMSRLSSIVNEFPNLWVDNGNTADVPEREWMDIPLLDNWRELYKPGQARVYPVGNQDREVIDKTFDKLHDQDRMEWTTEATPFTYPCFVLWKKGGNGERKGRVVVDIRALNKITLPDAYPVPLQSDILAAVSGAKFISTVDCSSFFYQWRVKPQDRHKLTVSSHRGQETFKVAVMGYRNSPAYVQRMIDRMLRPVRGFARAYMDDIVIFSTSLEEHEDQLRQIFGILEDYNICLSPHKSFIGYPSVALLGQRVDALGLATAEEKLAAIRKLAFPRTLLQLKHYLGLTGYMRQYVPFYAAIVRPLQNRKTLLNKSFRAKGVKGNGRKRRAGRLEVITPTPRELQAFYYLQRMFSRPSILVHFNPKRQMYIDMDSSKEGGHGAYAYHSTEEDPGGDQKAA